MRIGFDVSQTGRSKAGCGFMAWSLATTLAKEARQNGAKNEFLIYPTFGDFFWDPDWRRDTFKSDAPGFNRLEIAASHEEAIRVWRNDSLDIDSVLGQPDLVHSNNFYCPRRLKAARVVFTLYDISFIEHPEFTTEENRAGCFAGVFDASLYADYIVAISDYSRKHFLEYFPHFPEDRISVVHLAARGEEARPTSRPTRLPDAIQDRGFWLSVGTIEPRKNQIRLLQAYAEYRERSGRGLPLVFAGGKGWMMSDFDERIREMGLGDSVHVLGYIEDPVLSWLYEHCYALVYPSLFEGFGLPVVEAMSMGRPVITSDVSSLPEVAGDAALLVNPRDTGAIGAAMLRLETEPGLHSELERRSQAQARRFSWERSATELLACYERTLRMSRRGERGHG